VGASNTLESSQRPALAGSPYVGRVTSELDIVTWLLRPAGDHSSTRCWLRVGLILLATVSGGLSAGVFGAEVWTTPTTLFAADRLLTSPTVLTDSAGDVHAFFAAGEDYSESKAIMYTHRSGAASWSEPVTVLQPDHERSLAAPAMTLDARAWLQVIYNGPRSGRIEHRRVQLSQVTDPAAWSRPTPLSAAEGLSSAIVASRYRQVHVLYASRTHQVFYHRSDDGGATWSDAIQVSAADPKRQACAGTRLAIDGRGRLHAVWMQAHLPQGWPPAGVFYSRSLDAGLTWSPPRQLAGDNYTDINVATLGDDQVHVVWGAVASVGDRLHQWSRDGGEKWTAAQRVSDQIRGGMTGVPGLAFDSSGTLHLVTSVDGPRGVERIFHLTWKRGAWSEPQFISAGTDAVDSVEFPALAIGRGTQLYVVYEGDFRSIWFTEHRGDAPLPPQSVPSRLNDLLQLRILLVLIAVLGVERLVQLVRRRGHRPAR
jgi:hypothetical protein